MTKFLRRLFRFGLIVPLTFLAGCRSVPPSPQGVLAWVEISGHERTAIEAALQAVMRENEFRPGVSLSGEFVFEKKASAMNTLAYGGWTSGVKVRIKTTLVPQASGAVILSCNSYMVSGAGDEVFEEEHKLTRLHRSTYQKLLEDVRARLAR